VSGFGRSDKPASGKDYTGDAELGPAFEKWRQFSQETPEFRAAGIIKGGTVTPLAQEVLDA